MVPSEFTDPFVLTYALGALIQLAAAIWVFSLAPGDPRHRSFAVLVTVNAFWDLVEGLFFAAAPPRDDYYLRVYTHLAIWSSAALVWFLALYPNRRRRSAAIGWIALAAALVLSVWFAVDRSAAETPVFALVSLAWTPLLALGAWLTLRIPLARPDDPRGWSMILVASAFLVYPLSQAVTMLLPTFWANFWQNLVDIDSTSGLADAVVEVAYFVARLAALILAGLAVYAASRQRENPGGKATLIAVLLGAVLFSRILDALGFSFPALNALIFGVIITYALARARLFDIDLRLKLTVSRGTVVAAFTFVFILVSQLVEAFFQDNFGQNYIIAALACGLLLFALTPLQRWAERLADGAMPDVQRTRTYEDRRKQDVYRQALADVWSDGRITVKERRLLDAFAAQLHLDPTEAAQLEIDVVRSLPVEARKPDG